LVYDLKLEKPVIRFVNDKNVRQRNSVPAWNPEVATQMAIGSGDDAYPLLRIWDLRNSSAPVRELAGHTVAARQAMGV